MKRKLVVFLCALSLIGLTNAQEASETSSVAAVTIGTNTTEYASLDEAIAAANKEGATQAVTVKLLRNVTRTTDVGLGAANPITLNLAGFTLDCGSAQLYTKSTGLVTLTGNGTVKNNAATNADYAAIWVISSSALKLDGVTVEGNYCAVKNSGTLEVAAATIKATKYGISNFGNGKATIGTKTGDNTKISVTSGWQAIATAAATCTKDASVVVYGGSFTTSGTNWDEDPIYWAGHGTLEVYGGTFKNTVSNTKAAGLLQKNGTVAVYGGTFSAKDGIKLVAQGDSTELTTTIQGGTFTGTRSGLYIDAEDATNMGRLTAYEVTIANGETATPTFKGGTNGALYTKTAGLGSRTLMTLTGGLYNEDPSAYCTAGCIVTETTVEGETLWAVQPAVAQIGETAYTSLAEAVDAVPADGPQTTIVLLQDCTGSGVVVDANKNIIFDLNGKTYTVTNPTVGSSGTETNGFQLLKDATVTFQNGTIESASAKILIQNYCNLTLDGVTLNAKKNAQIRYALSNNFGQVTVTGKTKIYASAGQVAFDLYYWPKGGYGEGVSVTFDADFTGQVEGKIEYARDNTTTDEICAKKAILTVAEGAQGLFDITFSTSVKEPNIQLKGGFYTSKPSTAYCAEGYMASETTVDGKALWTVQPAVAQIGETAYTSLAAAVDAVPADGTQTTIVLLQSCTGSGVKVAADKNIVFNLNGKTYTVTNPVGSSGTETNGFQLLQGATVTFQNGTIESASAKILIQNYCNLTLDGVTLNAKKNAQIEYALSNNCGQVTVTGATKIYASAGQVAFDLYYWPKGGYGEGVSVTFDADFTGQVEGTIVYARDDTTTDETWAEKVCLTVAEGAQGLFDVTFSTSVKEPNIQLKGGRYTKDPSTYCAKGYMASETMVDGKALWTVQPAVASITSGETTTTYATLEEAISAAQAGDTVKLLQDVTVAAVGEKEERDVDVSGLTIDLNGKVLGVPKLAFVFYGTNFTIKNGTIDGLGASYALWIGCGEPTDNVTIDSVVAKGGANIYVASNITFIGTTELHATDYYAVWADEEVSSVTLLSGSYYHADLMPILREDETSAGAIKVQGGLFTQDPSAYCAEGYMASATTVDGKTLWTVQPAVASITSGETMTTYASLEEAIATAQPGDTVTLLQDVTQEDGFELTKDLTLDLNYKTFTVKEGSSTLNRNIKVTGTANLTVKNGTMVAGGECTAVNHGTNGATAGTGCYGTLRFESTGELVVTDVTLKNSRPWGMNLKLLSGTAKLENVTILSTCGGGVEVAGNEADHTQHATVTMRNCTIKQTYKHDHTSACVAVSYGGKLTVESGSYTSDFVAVYVYNSGGIQTIQGGTFTGATYAIKADKAANASAAEVHVSGGTFVGPLAESSGAKISLTGGQYTVDPTAYCANGYSAYRVGTMWEVREGNSLFVVVDKQGQETAVGSLKDLLIEENVGTKVYIIAPSAETDAAVAAALESAKATTGSADDLKDATEVTGLTVKEVAEVLGGAFTVSQENAEPKLVYHYNFGVSGLEVRKQPETGKLGLTVVAKLTEGEGESLVNRTLVGRTLQVVLTKGNGSEATYDVVNPVFNEKGECRVPVPWSAMKTGTNSIRVKVVK